MRGHRRPLRGELLVDIRYVNSSRYLRLERRLDTLLPSLHKCNPIPATVPTARTQPVSKDEESAADRESGGYIAVEVHVTFKNGRYVVKESSGV